MRKEKKSSGLEKIRRSSPGKFVSAETAFSRIHWGDRVFIGTGCSEPQHLLSEFISYVRNNPKALIDAEVIQLWALGGVPYADLRFRENLRHNSFFIGKDIREAVNAGLADYTPASLADIPDMFRRGLVPVDVAMIQTSLPDKHGYLNLGVSVDAVKAAAQKAHLVIAQVNSRMPRVYGDGFIHADDVDYVVPYDEPILQYEPEQDTETSRKIGSYISRLVHDGNTIQIGYGSILNGIAPALQNKKHLGIHTELLSDGLVALMKKGAADNSEKTLNPGKTVAAFCMGEKKTYDYLNDNQSVEFRTIDYTDNPMVIAQHDNMTAINSALAIDLTGQATSESAGRLFYGGVGGQPCFMRGAVMARNGKAVLVVQSTAENGKASRIMPFLPEGAGVTLNRGDVHYVVTEYGIAHLHGKNIRERAIELIEIAHPKFRSKLIEEAKKLKLIYGDQAYVQGKRGRYPAELEAYRTTCKGLSMFLRPVKMSDEPQLKKFFYSLSEDSTYRRFASARKDMLHARLKDYAATDYTRRMIMLATLPGEESEEVIGIGEYDIDEKNHTGELAFVVRDDFHNRGVGKELLKHLTYAAKKKGILGFTAEVLTDNEPMIHIFKDMGYEQQRTTGDDMYHFSIIFKRGQ